MSICFCGGQTNFDVVFVVNEVVDELLYRKREEVLCKLDMEKGMIMLMGFCRLRVKDRFRDKWRKWIELCITAISFLVMVNEDPSSIFKTYRGLKHYLLYFSPL